MVDRPWKTPVIFALRGQRHIVRTTGEALAILLNVWPVADGRAFLTALESCTDAEAGVHQPADARSAFIRAAREAGVKISTGAADPNGA
jgi:hypothetical protein